MHKLNFIDITFIIAYLVACLIIGCLSSKKINNIKEYALGSRYIPTVILIGTMLATHIGAGSMMGTAEKAFSMGLIFVLAMIFSPFFWLITAKIFANNISYFKEKDCISISDIMHILYGAPGRWVTNMMSLIFSIFLLTVQVTAIGYLFNHFLGVSTEISAIAGFSILVLYSFFGGVRVVVLTDVFQGIIFFIGLPIACSIAFIKTGGFLGLMEKLPSSHLAFDINKENITLFISLLIYALLPISYGPFIQRFLMAHNEAQLNSTLRMSFIAYIPFVLVVCLMGYIIKAQSPDLPSNIVFFELITNNLPHGFLGLLIVGLLAAIMSTADSWLNSASILFAHDIIKQICPKITNMQEVWVARVSVLIISLVASFFALTNSRSLLNLIWISANFWEPMVLIPITFGFLKFRTNSYSFLGACFLGMSSVLLGRYLTGEFATISMTLGMIGSSIGLLATHYIQKAGGLIEVSQEAEYTYSTSETSSGSILSEIEDWSLKNIWRLIMKAVNQEIDENGKLYALGGMICVIHYIASLFFWPTILNVSIDTSIMALKTIGAISCLIFYAYEYGFDNIFTKYVSLYFYFILAWMFPTITTYTIYLYGLDTIWIVDLIFGMLVLYALTGRKVLPILMIMGILMGVALGALRLSYSEVYFPGINKMIGAIYSIILTAMLFVMLKVKDGMLHAIIAEEIRRGGEIAHEVMQPMSYVSLSAGTLENAIGKYSLPVNPMYQVKQADMDIVQTISKNLDYVAEKGKYIVKNILTMSRTDMDKAEDIKEYDIKEILDAALELHLRLPERASRIEVDLTNSFKVRGSKHFLAHAVGNIIENSMKYAGRSAILRIWCEDRKLYLRDNGVGMDADQVPNIFNKYKNMDGKLGGTGLGMNFCKRVIEAYGGSIKAKSEKGKYMEIVFIFSEF